VHLNDALRYGEAQAGAALLAGDGIVGLLKLLEQLGLIGGGDARPCVADRYMERAVIRFGLNGNFARIGEFDGTRCILRATLLLASIVSRTLKRFRILAFPNVVVALGVKF
jgi:hypothetical protein